MVPVLARWPWLVEFFWIPWGWLGGWLVEVLVIYLDLGGRLEKFVDTGSFHGVYRCSLLKAFFAVDADRTGALTPVEFFDVLTGAHLVRENLTRLKDFWGQHRPMRAPAVGTPAPLGRVR